MEAQPERVYVAVGTDWYDGFSTLQWTLRKWSDNGIRIVILQAENSICKDYVYTPRKLVEIAFLEFIYALHNFLDHIWKYDKFVCHECSWQTSYQFCE